MREPFTSSKGLAVLRGNLAPNTGITKPAAIDPSMLTFTGTAKTFDCEEDAAKADIYVAVGHDPPQRKLGEGESEVVNNV